MSLDIYEYDSDNNQYLLISRDGLQNRPVQTTHDGTNGEVQEKKLFLRNSDDALYYSDITLQPSPESMVRVGDINFPEANIEYKIIFKENQPTKSEWAAVQSGDSAFQATVGTTDLADTAYKPFWIQVGVPPGTRIGALRGILIDLDSEENPIGG
jgi:hypothetical protein